MAIDTNYVAPGFEGVASAFFATIPDGRRAGAALSVWKEGAPVVSLASGTADESMRPFSSETLIPVASVTKGLASLVIARLVELGIMPGYDTEIGEFWPEFAAHGKGKLSIGNVLAHRAGLSAPRETLPKAVYLDSIATADVLAAQEPLWTPGQGYQYHNITHGALTAKLAFLATGRSLGSLFAQDMARPLSADAWIGLPEEYDDRVASIVPEACPAAPVTSNPNTYWLERAVNLGSGVGFPELVESAESRRAEMPGVNGFASADAVAKIYSASVVETEGVRLLSDASVDELRKPRSMGAPVFGGPPPYQSFGAGVMIPSHWAPYLTEYSFGHDGALGQVAFADPYFKVGFAYFTNQAGDWERGRSVTQALSRALS
ncbi:serine hydrolase domain-containing protein [Arthrobacter sp. W4I7]|uniref:serine hydrolase domain-containing protein n=1 Tax=Arthrobacter sp. W4I7 TaxID=3042296 RepID=UPI002789975F|nr:serine hydrolase domain-containing protein [Arthrobacter sp. W4I7]MDQ0691262.1 CubicO group peptidase (beta-lactamase class C family) [Arthrobacter sp. W4I7]